MTKNHLFSAFLTGVAFLSPLSALAASNVPRANYQNPLGVGSFTELIVNLLSGLQNMIGFLTVIMIVIGGIMYMLSAGNTSKISKAKEIITLALFGFIIVVAAPTLLKEILSLASGGASGPDVIQNAPGIYPILEKVLSFLLATVGLLATIGLVLSGISLLSAAGDTSKADQAKRMARYSILALAISGGALVLLNQVIKLLS